MNEQLSREKLIEKAKRLGIDTKGDQFTPAVQAGMSLRMNMSFTKDYGKRVSRPCQ